MDKRTRHRATIRETLKRVTLKDVAARAGVSYQTVSKVLNGQGHVSPITEQLIHQVVSELGYSTNVTARNLRKSSSGLIGYSWTPEPRDQQNPVMDQFLSSIVAAAEAVGYHVMLFPNGSTSDQAASYRRLIGAGRVDGFIISSTNYDDARIQLLGELTFPFVSFGNSNPEWSFTCVEVDNRAGLLSAVQHLVEQGHSQIAMLGWPEDSRVGNDRLKGYVQGMHEANLAVEPLWIKRGEGSADQGYALTQQLLALPLAQRPTAVVTMDDRLAMGAVHAAQVAGLRVGPEFAVTGFDDTPSSQHFSPPITSLRQPIWEIGQKSIESLMDLIGGQLSVMPQIVLPPQLMIRESSLRT